MRFPSHKHTFWMLGIVLTLASANTSRADEALRKVQQSLRDQGFYYGSIDGSPGDETTQAIRRYQIRNGLAVTGQLNDETRNAVARTGTASGGAGTSPTGRGASGAAPSRVPTTAPDASTVPGSRSVPAPSSNSRDRVTGNDEPDYRLVPRQTVQPPSRGNGSINGNDDQDNADDQPNVALPPYRGGGQDRPDLRVPPSQYGGGSASNPPPAARYGTAPSPTLTALFEQTPYEFAPPPVQADLLRRVQIQLGRSGCYDGEADGRPGQRTTEAIVNFQEVNRLRRTARLDISTLETLRLLPDRPQYADPRGYPRPRRGVYEGRIVE